MPYFQYSYPNTIQLVNTNKENCQPYFHYQTKKKREIKTLLFLLAKKHHKILPF